MLYECPLVYSEIQKLPVFIFAEELTVVAKSKIRAATDFACRSVRSPVGNLPHLFDRELAMHKIPQVALDLAREQKRPSELLELTRKIARSHYTADGIVSVLY